MTNGGRIIIPFARGLALVWIAATLAGCGSNITRQPAPQPVQPLVIVTQPASQSIPLGNAATFTVAATGTAPLSYQWSMNGTKIQGVYDSRVISAAPEEVGSDVAQLASQGYILTAFGGDMTHGFLLIGTKVKGDTLPRLVYDINPSSSPMAPGFLNGYATVASLDYLTPSGTQAGYDDIYEK